MKKLILAALVLFFTSCIDVEYDDFFAYRIKIESPVNQHILIEYYDPITNNLFSEIIYHNTAVSYWEFKNLYIKGDYLYIYVKSLDPHPATTIYVDILLHGKYIRGGMGNGLYPIEVDYI